ncbi:MAG TPA: hypothetical protein VKH42_05570 [Vicinamibacterales bacterium]|nr:hypothetical protein [Vicinamibacterales bacterium]
MNDSTGDAVVSAGVPTPPDMVHGTLDVSGGNLTVTVQFAPGTLDPQTTRLTVQLDTDQNAGTGVPPGNGLGIDYVLDVWPRTSQTIVQRATPATCVIGAGCYADAGTVGVTVGTNTMTATVPLSMLGSGSGPMNYRIVAYASPQSSVPAVVADQMPDLTLAPAHIP